MKNSVVFVFALFFFVQTYGRPQEQYSDKFDNMNVDEILSNKRLLGNYVSCLLDTGKCSPDGTELKKVLPDALKTNCDKCSDVQKKLGEKILVHLIEKEPDSYKKLEDKFDPEGLYKKQISEKLGRDL